MFTTDSRFFVNGNSKNCKSCIILGETRFEKLVRMADVVPVVQLLRETKKLNDILISSKVDTNRKLKK